MSYHKPAITDTDMLEAYKKYRRLTYMPYDLFEAEIVDNRYGEKRRLNSNIIKELAKEFDIDEKLLRRRLYDNIILTLTMHETKFDDLEYFCNVCKMSNEPYYLNSFLHLLGRIFGIHTKEDFLKLTEKQIKTIAGNKEKFKRVCLTALGYPHDISKNGELLGYEICINTICNGELNVSLANRTYSKEDARAINWFLNELNKHLGEGVDSIYLVKKIGVKNESKS